MIKYIITLLVLPLLFSITNGQTDPIAAATYHFKMENGALTGAGADSLKTNIAQSQFFLIGEEHDMVQLQQLTAAIMPFLKENDYRHFAVEIGPASASKLTSIYKKKESLSVFNNRYAKYLGRGPFGFFDGQDEELLLKGALNNGINLWGIDFENYNASLFILDELFQRSSRDKQIKVAYEDARKYVINEYALDKVTKKYPLCANFLSSSLIKRFFSLIEESPESKWLIDQITQSWRLCQQERLNNWHPRVINMKSNFVQAYKEAGKNESLPKVFVKLGAVHTARGTSSSGFQEVGNTLYELAKYNGTKSFSVISFARYRIDKKGVLTDELDPDDSQLLKYTDEKSWSLINLKQLAKDGWEGKIKLSKTMQNYMQKYDMMLIPPATKRMEPNYTF
jgi:hypothetical protein